MKAVLILEVENRWYRTFGAVFDISGYYQLSKAMALIRMLK